MTSEAPEGVIPTIPVPEWEAPWPMRGEPGYVRVTGTMLRGTGCREQLARKARPDAYPVGDAPREPAGFGSFPLSLVRDALVLLLGTGPDGHAAARAQLPGDEASGSDRVRAAIALAVEGSWQEWPEDSRPAVEAGVVGYLELLESLRASGELPDSMMFEDVIAVQNPDAERVEFWAWALHHVSRDGRIREAHLLRWQDAGAVTLSPPEIALVAEVAADGVISGHDKWYQRFVPVRGLVQPPAAHKIRVRVVGVLDATSALVFSGSPEDARESFGDLVPGAVQVLAGGSTRPSGACAGCNVRHVCPGLPALPGVLGVAGFSPATRAVSPSALWTHGACPRQLYLARDLGLPRARREPSEALHRGVQVHEWLRLAHERGVACSADDLAGLGEEGPEFARSLGWSQSDHAAHLPYLRQHLAVCPLQRAGVTRLRSEVDITVWDTDANVIFTTRPDATYLDADGAWVLRETKTVSPRGFTGDRTALLQRYPQVAAAVCLLADGYRPDVQDVPHPGRVELELLGPDAADVLVYDAADPLTVLVARTALADRVDAWLFDDTHPVGEHPPCGTCDVVRWCGRESDPAVRDAADALAQTLHRAQEPPGLDAPDAVLRDFLGVADDAEEFPF